MSPPSLATYGLFTNDKDLLQQAYDQIRLYRLTLQDPKTKLWTHIFDYDTSKFIDQNLWSTGLGWVTGGIVRTLAAISKVSQETVKLLMGSTSLTLLPSSPLFSSLLAVFIL